MNLLRFLGLAALVSGTATLGGCFFEDDDDGDLFVFVCDLDEDGDCDDDDCDLGDEGCDVADCDEDDDGDCDGDDDDGNGGGGGGDDGDDDDGNGGGGGGGDTGGGDTGGGDTGGGDTGGGDTGGDGGSDGGGSASAMYRQSEAPIRDVGTAQGWAPSTMSRETGTASAAGDFVAPGAFTVDRAPLFGDGSILGGARPFDPGEVGGGSGEGNGATAGATPVGGIGVPEAGRTDQDDNGGSSRILPGGTAEEGLDGDRGCIDPDSPACTDGGDGSGTEGGGMSDGAGGGVSGI